jgi:hypothetical protein
MTTFSAVPALQALLAGIIDGVQRGDLFSARATAKALAALLHALPAPSGDGQVIKLAERRAAYQSRKTAR